MFKIQTACLSDLDTVMKIIDQSRAYMRKTGNHTQWINGYPSREIMQAAVEASELHVCLENNCIHGVFCWSLTPDPNYDIIKEGHWLNEEKYGVIHRLAGDGSIRGLGQKVIEWCATQHPNIRIDTHESNKPMLKLLNETGFEYCGIIYVSDGTPRLAFQKIF